MAHGNRKERTKASQRLKVAEDSRDDRLGYLGSPIITIVVGGDMGLVHEFHIHKDLLMRNSDYFKGALQKDFIEGAENTVTLPDIEVQSFNLFARWIYSSGVQCDVAHFMNEDHLQLVKAYILGDRILAPTFQFLLCFTLANTFLGLVDIGWQEIGGEVKTLKVPSIDEVLKAVKIVYAGTSRDGDFLKMVLVSHAAYRMHNGNTCGPHPQAKQWDKSIPTWTPEAVQAMGDSGPQDFLRDVLLEGHNPGCSFEKVSDIYLEYLDS